MVRPPPRSTLFPYTTLFRSLRQQEIAPQAMDLGLAIALPGFLDQRPRLAQRGQTLLVDRKSTRLNSSHVEISYAVFCLKKKKQVIYIFAAHRNKSHVQADAA